jgi:hypothetical protein
VSVDGEVTDMPTPLHYRVRRGGLKVIRPMSVATEPGFVLVIEETPTRQ